MSPADEKQYDDFSSDDRTQGARDEMDRPVHIDVDCVLGRRDDEVLDLFANELAYTVLTESAEPRPLLLALSLSGELSPERLRHLQALLREVRVW